MPCIRLSNRSNIKIQKLTKPETTYNFEVQDFHTYFINKTNILVHNDCIEDGLTKISQKGKLYDCEGTANEMEKFMKQKGLTEGVDYHRVNVQSVDKGYIDSIRYGGHISENGYHVGIEYKGLIYDNLQAGVSRQNWLNDFIATSQCRVYRGQKILNISQLFG